MDLTTNAQHCGACNKLCGSGQVCADGLCGCPAGQLLCSGACVDPLTNGANCGGCAVVCAAGTICSAGICGDGTTGVADTAAVGGGTGIGGTTVTGGATAAGGTTGTGGAVTTATGGMVPVESSATGGTGGAEATGGATATGGADATGGAEATGGAAGAAGAEATGGTGGIAVEDLDPFSFFVTSYEAMVRLSGDPDGFGGDLRYGEADGLSGADKICTEIAEFSMPGASAKGWRAFLSVTDGPDGQVDAIDRIGEGPWYDRLGRTVALNIDALLNTRPDGADPEIVNDLPNEYGVPNHDPDGTGDVDNHDTLTGTDSDGRLYGSARSTCQDWTSTVGSDGQPRVGHTWPRNSGGGNFGGGGMDDWISALDESGCEPGAWLIEAGAPGANGTLSVGDGGGYGGIYCFALNP